MKSLKFISVILSALTALLFLPVSPAGAAVNTVCAGSPPTGWVKTNDFWDPTRCGNPDGVLAIDRPRTPVRPGPNPLQRIPRASRSLAA